MKTLRLVGALIALIITASLTACDDTLDNNDSMVSATVAVTMPSEAAGATVLSQQLAVTNLTTNQTATYSTLEGIKLEAGLYTLSYDAQVNITADGTTQTLHVKAYAASVQITSAAPTVTMTGYLDASNDDFIIREIFFTGTLRSSGNSYLGDQYVVIYNNTDHVLYADGLSLVESKFLTTDKYEYTPDIMNEAMTVDAIYTIPGNGSTYPVQPGESLILADNGMDHRVLNEYSFDLSGANFEWYDLSSSASNVDIDSPEVPNLDKWYCYTKSYWILHNRGFKAYALARIPVDKDTYLGNYLYTYDYTLVTSAGTFPMTQEAYRLPNQWIVDAVNLSVASNYAWNVTAPALDRGWSHCGSIDRDQNRFFKSVRRKFLYMKDGRAVLQDTNNSTDDFNGDATPSLIEQQGSVTDALGNRATKITHDGVTPVE